MEKALDNVVALGPPDGYLGPDSGIGTLTRNPTTCPNMTLGAKMPLSFVSYTRWHQPRVRLCTVAEQAFKRRKRVCGNVLQVISTVYV